jgi:hypothetical protein
MAVSERLAAVDAALQSAKIGEAADIERLRHRKGANDQGFTITMFAMTEVSRCSELVGMVRGLLKKEEYTWDQVKDLSLVLLRRHADTLDRRFALADTAAFVTSLADAVEVGDKPGVERICYTLGSYLGYLNFLIAVEIPWHELAVAFEGARTVKKALADRMVPEFSS